MIHYLTTFHQVCWIPIFKGKKLILAGDPMQLPPTILSVDQHGKKAKGNSTTKNVTPPKTGGKKTSTVSDANPSSDDVVEEPPASETDPSSDSDADEEELSEKDREVVSTPAPVKEAKKKKRTPRPRSLRLPRSLETTLFDRLEKMYGPGIKRMLNVQYRCAHPSSSIEL